MAVYWSPRYLTFFPEQMGGLRVRGVERLEFKDFFTGGNGANGGAGARFFGMVSGTQPKIDVHLIEIADEVFGLRQPAAAFRHAACCEPGKQRFHRAFPVPMPPDSQQGCMAKSYSRL
jgi:hypothetical protein